VAVFIVDPEDPTGMALSAPLSLGLYVDNFVYFSKDPDVEALFCHLLRKCCKFNFIGIVEWFLGVYFSWLITPYSILLHLNQSGFASNLVKNLFWELCNPIPTAKPYCLGISINSIAPSTDDNNLPAQICFKEAYQSLIGSIGWLAMTTCLNLSAIHSFLSSYSNKPMVSHMKAALYALHYIHSTYNHEISLTLENLAPIHSFVHFPPETDVEAYKDTIPHKKSTSATLSAYSDACWGSQIGSAIAKGTRLPLFKLQSMNGGIDFQNGGLVRWLGKQQEHTALSSCKAEICATNATSTKVVNCGRGASESGHSLADIDSLTTVYNGNDACVKWLHNMTSKAA
jgi:hypothetical protein